MPGVKSIMWTSENDVKLFRALCVHAAITMNKQAAEAVAAYLGPGVPPKAIFSRLNLVKKKFKNEVGFTTADNDGNDDGVTPTKKRPSASSTSNTPKRKRTSIKEETKSEENEDALAENEPTILPKSPTGKHPSVPASKSMIPTSNAKIRTISQGIVSQRSSPRKAGKMDYSRIHDPFKTMENVFGSDNGTSGEDSADSDIDVVDAGVVDSAEEDDEDEGGNEV